MGESGDSPDWEALSRYKEQLAAPTAASTRSQDDEHPNYENMVSKSETLQEYVMDQIGELDFDDEEKHIASNLVGNIDDRGYLNITLEEVAKSLGTTTDAVDDILDTIQRLEPSGIAARNLQECLHIQLRNRQLKNGIVEKIIENHMSDLETRNFPAIAKALKITIDQVIENVQIVAELEPVPGRQFGGGETQYVTPDVYVFKLGDEWIVNLNEEGLPRLRVSDTYLKLLSEKQKAAANAKMPEEAKDSKKKKSSDEEDYVSEKMKSAEWLIKSIRQRQRTIFKVTESIVERQKDFFEKGTKFLKPMILKDIAEDIEMHESTISRVTNNKFVHTPRGVFELKYFFNSTVTRSDGESLASESVKVMIAEIVKEENPKKPYSEQKIVELLEEKGIPLARRTVAKYREQLDILPSNKRKKLF